MSVFDRVIDRRGTDSTKWRRYAEAGPDVIPAWVADMDFAAPKAVLEALRARLEHGVFGYAPLPSELVEQILDRLERLYGWRVAPDWLVPLPGVVPGLYLACQSSGDPGDSVLTGSPIYYHFLSAPTYSNRQRIEVPCPVVDGRYVFDLERMAAATTDSTRLLLLCNPWNPVARCLTRGELEAIASFCLERDLLICSDEIHADLLLDPDRAHLPIASLGAEVAARTITLVSPSKTFNLPGVGGFALAIIPDAALRSRFEDRAHGVSAYPGALAYEAALAAYRDCDGWRSELLCYLAGNRNFLEAEIAKIPGLRMNHVEATFLAWIDFSASGLAKPWEEVLAQGVALTDGADLGDPDYLRLNFGCPRSTLEEIVRRVRAALQV